MSSQDMFPQFSSRGIWINQRLTRWKPAKVACSHWLLLLGSRRGRMHRRCSRSSRCHFHVSLNLFRTKTQNERRLCRDGRITNNLDNELQEFYLQDWLQFIMSAVFTILFVKVVMPRGATWVSFANSLDPTKKKENIFMNTTSAPRSNLTYHMAA